MLQQGGGVMVSGNSGVVGTGAEPLYAQVNMEKKRNRQASVAGNSNHFDPGDHDETRTHMTAGKDSWV